jgi:hypothetical protein
MQNTSIRVTDEHLCLTCGSEEFIIDASPNDVSEIRASLKNLLSGALPSDEPVEQALFKLLNKRGLVGSTSPKSGQNGTDALLHLEDEANDLLYRTLYRNVFWQHLQSPSTFTIPKNVIYGFVIENYHFLFRESWFDSPALPYASSTDVRRLMNQFYEEEYGHDELLLKALNSVGITREDLTDSLPLPETLALCNALAYWASTDPIFFFSTLGILEGKDVTEDSFLKACDSLGYPPDFIGPIRAHSNINLKGGHGLLSREMFRHIPYIDDETLARMLRQTSLFVQLYDAFYTAVWNYYSTASTLLRRISAI